MCTFFSLATTVHPSNSSATGLCALVVCKYNSLSGFILFGVTSHPCAPIAVLKLGSVRQLWHFKVLYRTGAGVLCCVNFMRWFAWHVILITVKKVLSDYWIRNTKYINEIHEIQNTKYTKYTKIYEIHSAAKTIPPQTNKQTNKQTKYKASGRNMTKLEPKIKDS